MSEINFLERLKMAMTMIICLIAALSIAALVIGEHFVGAGLLVIGLIFFIVFAIP